MQRPRTATPVGDEFVFTSYTAGAYSISGSVIALDASSSLLIQNVAPDTLRSSDFSFV